jgi:hypothetical protein
MAGPSETGHPLPYTHGFIYISADAHLKTLPMSRVIDINVLEFRWDLILLGRLTSVASRQVVCEARIIEDLSLVSGSGIAVRVRAR